MTLSKIEFALRHRPIPLPPIAILAEMVKPDAFCEHYNAAKSDCSESSLLDPAGIGEAESTPQIF